MIERHRKNAWRELSPLKMVDDKGVRVCRPQEELDLIAYVGSNLQTGTNLKEMKKGPDRFWCKYKLENK
jgi:hypothetical protein